MTNLLLHGIDVPSNVRHDNTLARPLRDWGPKERVDVIVTNPPFGGMEEDGIESNFPAEFRTRETADLFLVLLMKMPFKPGGRAGLVLPDGTLFGEGVKTRIKEASPHRVQPPHHRPPAQRRLQSLHRHPHQPPLLQKGEPTKDVWYYEHQVPEGQKAYSMTKPIRFEHLKGCIDWWGGAKRKGRKETSQAWMVTADEVKARGYNLDIKNPHTVANDHGDPEELLQSLNAAETETTNLRDQLKAILAEALAR